MDNPVLFQNQDHRGDPATASPAGENAPQVDAVAVIEQVRELLFGDHRRSTETSLKGLEDKIAALTASLEAKFSDLERRFHDLKSETDHARDVNVVAIGDAIMELGGKIKGMGGKPSAESSHGSDGGHKSYPGG